MPVAVTGLVRVPVAVAVIVRIGHDTQDARNIRLQHVNNSHPHANAKHPQPGQAGASSAGSSVRH